MENRAIITAGRDDASGKASPSVVTEGRLPVSAGWRPCFYFFFLSFISRPNLIAFSTREAIIMTTEIISKSDMISPPQLSYSEAKSQAPSVSFLPGTRRFHLDYNTARWGTSNYVFPTNFSAKEHIHPRWEFFQADNKCPWRTTGEQQILAKNRCPPNGLLSA